MNKIEWKQILSRRLRDEALNMDCKQVDICNIRKMLTPPDKMYAVVVADARMYVVTGCNENEMATSLRVQIARDREQTINPETVKLMQSSAIIKL